jgi:hypothetical protein
MGDIVVSWHGQDGRPKALQKLRCALVLARPPAVREVTGGDDQHRREARNQLAQGRLDGLFLARPDVQVGEVDQADWHDRGTLYTQSVTEPTELFDDLYLGLRAGGAIRKRRRGESLTSEEEAALTGWQRLSQWRKTAAIGAFAVGTFGLGFTLGGIVFSRRRKQEAA